MRKEIFSNQKITGSPGLLLDAIYYSSFSSILFAEAIIELIDNAIRSDVSSTRIDIVLNKNTLSISDNGFGFTLESLSGCFNDVGNRGKFEKEGDASRYNVGHKKMFFISDALKEEIYSQRIDEEYSMHFIAKRNTLEREPILDLFQEPPIPKHGTSIYYTLPPETVNLLQKNKLIDTAMEYVGNMFAIAEGFEIYYNNVPIINREYFNYSDKNKYETSLFEDKIIVENKIVGSWKSYLKTNHSGGSEYGVGRMAGIEGQRIIEHSQAFTGYLPAFHIGQYRIHTLVTFKKGFLYSDNDKHLSSNFNKNKFDLRSEELINVLKNLNAITLDRYKKLVDAEKNSQNEEKKKNVLRYISTLLSKLSVEIDPSYGNPDNQRKDDKVEKPKGKPRGRPVLENLKHNKYNFVRLDAIKLPVNYMLNSSCKECVINTNGELYNDLNKILDNKQSKTFAAVEEFFTILLNWRAFHVENEEITTFLNKSAKFGKKLNHKYEDELPLPPSY